MPQIFWQQAADTMDEHSRKTLSVIRAAMSEQQDKLQARRLAGLAFSDQRSQQDARTLWWRSLATSEARTVIAPFRLSRPR